MDTPNCVGVTNAAIASVNWYLSTTKVRHDAARTIYRIRLRRQMRGRTIRVRLHDVPTTVGVRNDVRVTALTCFSRISILAAAAQAFT